MCIQIAVKRTEDGPEVLCSTVDELSEALGVPVPKAPDGECLCHLRNDDGAPLVLASIAGNAGLFFCVTNEGIGLMSSFDEVKARAADGTASGKAVIALDAEQANALVGALKLIQARAGSSGVATFPVPMGGDTVAMLTVEFTSVRELMAGILDRNVVGGPGQFTAGDGTLH